MFFQVLSVAAIVFLAQPFMKKTEFKGKRRKEKTLSPLQSNSSQADVLLREALLDQIRTERSARATFNDAPGGI